MISRLRRAARYIRHMSRRGIAGNYAGKVPVSSAEQNAHWADSPVKANTASTTVTGSHAQPSTQPNRLNQPISPTSTPSPTPPHNETLPKLIESMMAATFCRLGAAKLLLKAMRRIDNRNRVIILAYHKVVPDSAATRMEGIGASTFANQIQVLSKVFQIVSPERAMQILQSDSVNNDEKTYPLLITFDHGYANSMHYAGPHLKQRGIPWLLFISTEIVGTKQFIWTDEISEILYHTPLRQLTVRIAGNDGESLVLPISTPLQRQEAVALLKSKLKLLPTEAFEATMDSLRDNSETGNKLTHHDGTSMLDWDSLNLLIREWGMVPGSHTENHTILTKLSDIELNNTLTGSREKLQTKLGIQTPYVAYPNGGAGDFDTRVMSEAKAKGYQFGFTMIPRIASEEDNPMSLPRIAPGNETGPVLLVNLLKTLLRQIVSPTFINGETIRDMNGSKSQGSAPIWEQGDSVTIPTTPSITSEENSPIEHEEDLETTPGHPEPQFQASDDQPMDKMEASAPTDTPDNNSLGRVKRT